MNPTRLLGPLAVLAAVLPVSTLAAQPAATAADVPAPLQPWIQWVLDEVPDRACPVSGGRALCYWPGRLELDLGPSGGRFAQQVLLDRKLRFALPGSAARWPREVRVDGRPAPVLEQDGTPVVELAPGSHRIEGRFEWNALPERLEVPGTTALIALRTDGKDVPFPRRDEHGQLWLLPGSGAERESEQLGLVVTRKLEDGVPVIVTTRIALRVAGRAREVNLGKVLLEGTLPLSVHSDLPARLEGDGELRLQVRAGTYAVELRARSDGPREAFAFRSAGPAWPEAEVWVWQADEMLRQVELRGAPAVDPARTELGEDWRGLPAFALRDGAALQLTTVRRGEPTPPPNRLTLERELWLDLDGRGYTVRDRLQAELRHGFRLDLLEGELGRVRAGGEDLLITKSASSGRSGGVELRAASPSIVAEWRAPDRVSTLPAVGWSEDVQSLAATLHLGPGYSVFAARGVDGLSQSWLQDWDLFDFFFVLLITAAVGRLAGRAAALLALLVLVLCHDQPDAPGAIWFALLGAIALLRVLPAGWFRNAVRAAFGVVAIGLLLIALPFAVDQVRTALYPQLGFAAPMWHLLERHAMVQEEAEAEAAAEPTPTAAPAAPEPAPTVSQAAPDWLTPEPDGGQLADVLESSLPSRGKVGKSGPYSRALQQDPEATVQTGPGVPTWQWRTWHLQWSGPVDKTHQIELYLIPPSVNRALALARALLLALLLFVLLRTATPGRDKPNTTAPPAPAAGAPAAAAALLLAALVAPFAHAGSARAQLPEPELLLELRERLTKAPECRPSCASIDELRMRIADQRLELTLVVHAQDRASVRLPGPAATWVPAGIQVDGRGEAPAIALEDGFVHVRVEPGIHEIRAQGPLPPRDALTLAVLDAPRRARVQAEGYKVDGVREDGRVEGALQLSRLLGKSPGEELESAALPPWLLLERSIELGPSWRMTTRLSRVSPTGTPIRVRVPLLSGEAVTESALEVVDGAVQASFGRDDTEVEWSSRLAPRERLELAAARGQPWSERWTVLCGPIWRCELEGLTPTVHLTDGRYQPRWHPWPGESAVVRVTRPEPARGQSITIDSARLEVTPGVRMLKAELALDVRSSRGGVQHVELPKGARVQSLSIGGRERPLRFEQGRIGFTLEPGMQAVRIQWQQPQGFATVQDVPRVALSRPAVNAHVTLHVPEQRWLLWVRGPSWGPAVLFWGYLLLVVIAALLLGRVGARQGLPLRTHDWVLLGLGLTQVPAAAALCVTGWLFAFAYRARMPQSSRAVHNLTQIGLAGLTLGALGCLYAAVHAGLLLRPDMQVAGAGSTGSTLHWYVDRVAGALPEASVISAPLWLFRVLMLLWSLWLASRLLRWLRWAFGCYKQGGLWRSAPPKPQRAGGAPAAAPAAPGEGGPE